MSRLTPRQYRALLMPLPQERVSTRQQSGRTLSYVEAWDIKRHLIRIFGFGGFSSEVIRTDIVRNVHPEGERNYLVSVLVTLRLTIHPSGYPLAVYTESAVGSARLPDEAEALDMAVKTAESDALKRAAINLGDQFGLSLYNDGSLKPVVGFTTVEPEEAPQTSNESAQGE